MSRFLTALFFVIVLALLFAPSSASAATTPELIHRLLNAFNAKNETTVLSLINNDAKLRVVPDSCTTLNKIEYGFLIGAFFDVMTWGLQFVPAEELSAPTNLTAVVVQNLAIRGKRAPSSSSLASVAGWRASSLLSSEDGLESGKVGGFWWSDKYIVIGQVSSDGSDTVQRFDIFEDAGPPKTKNYHTMKARVRQLATDMTNQSLPVRNLMASHFEDNFTAAMYGTVTDMSTSAAHQEEVKPPVVEKACNYTCFGNHLQLLRAFKESHIHVDRVVAACNYAVVQQTLFAETNGTDSGSSAIIERMVVVYEFDPSTDGKVVGAEILFENRYWN